MLEAFSQDGSDLNRCPIFSFRPSFFGYRPISVVFGRITDKPAGHVSAICSASLACCTQSMHGRFNFIDIHMVSLLGELAFDV